MANEPQDDNNFYKGDSLLKAFGITSIVMLVATIWMFMDDFGRQWKGFQREFLVLKKQKYDKLIEAQNASLDQNKIKEIKDAIAVKEKELASRSQESEKLEDELVKLKTKEKIETLKFQDEKLRWDVKKFEYEAKYGHAFAHHAVEQIEEKHHAEAKTETAPAASTETKTEEAKKALEPIAHEEAHAEVTDPQEKAAIDKLLKHWQRVVELKNVASGVSQQVEAKTVEVKAFRADLVKLQKDLKVAQGDLGRLEAARDSAQFTLLKMVRNSPVLDMANPTMRIQQVVLPTIRDDIFFAQVGKVDRCTTCHQAIDTPGFEDAPQPFRTHPKLDLILGSRSPHPIEKIGCTVCHEGRGAAVEFTRSAHTPQNEVQKKQWEKKYGWHEMHHVIEKMVPLQYVEGKCHTCHRQTEYVAKGEKHNGAVQLIKASGCYGCHRIEGWDHIRKPAPSLKRVKGKLTRDWMVKWVSNPQSFNDHARMPASFFQSNVQGNEEFIRYQKAEVNALVDYVLSLSDGYEPNVHIGLGNADRGKELFGTIGCLGCHQVADFERHRGRFGQAPDLSTVGSKVSKDWLVSWLKNPRHYWAETTMPSLRLTDGEVSDLAAFLMSKKNPEFEAATPVETDEESQKAVLKMYLMRDPRMAPATVDKVDKVIADLKSHEIKEKLGQFAMSRYGCFGCHDIKGYETTQGIGAELTEWSSKLTNKLDFGLLPIEHTHYNWLDTKLTDTRVYDKGIVKEYLDLLRMPQFGFNEKERTSVITAMLGFTAQKIVPPAAKALSPKEALMEDGLRIVHKYNCQGCHVVEQMWQPLPDDHPNREAHEKDKRALEGRILAYYAEDETFGPPPLVTQGARIWPSFGYAFLNDPNWKHLRPKLKVRMPTFQMSSEEINKIVTYWASYGGAEIPYSDQKPITMTPENQKAAQALFAKLQCANCHAVGQAVSVADMNDPASSKGLAPDLALSYGRLKREWIVELLKDPNKMIPGARMPGFWPEMQSPAPEILEGNSQKQMEVLADYVLMIGQGRRAQKVASSPQQDAFKQALIAKHLKKAKQASE